MFNICFYLIDKRMVFILSHIFSKILNSNLVFFLIGNIGVGKTTFLKGLIGLFLNYKFLIKSPTYSFVETYDFKNLIFYHFDFFRFLKKTDFFDIDVFSYLKFNSLLFIEWGNKFFFNIFFPHICLYIFFYSNFFDRFFFLRSDFYNFLKLFR